MKKSLDVTSTEYVKDLRKRSAAKKLKLQEHNEEWIKRTIYECAKKASDNGETKYKYKVTYWRMLDGFTYKNVKKVAEELSAEGLKVKIKRHIIRLLLCKFLISDNLYVYTISISF